MRSILLYLGWGWLFIVLQVSLFAFLPLGEARPDLLFFLVLYLGIEFGTLGGAILVFFLGYVLDLVSSSFFGLNSLLALLLFFGVSWVSRRVDPRHPPFWAVAIAVFSVGEILFFWFWPWLLNPGAKLPAGLFSALVLRTVGNLVVGLPVLKLLYLADNRRGRESAPQL
ncbi:MAG: rod shape-determining protein MreD [bacterium]|nr:rod shape-determining protein MreD [bacterium]